MHRREFLAGTAATLAAAPRFGWAQERVPRLAYVGAAGSVERMTAAGGSARSEAFHREIRRLGYIEGENLTIEYWTGAGRDGDGFASFAREIVASKPDLITLTGGNPALASVDTNVTQRPMTGKTTLRRPHCN